MLNIEETVDKQFPALANQPDIIRKPTLSLLRKMTAEQRINEFLSDNDQQPAFAFIERLFDYFQFRYHINQDSLKRIPVTGAAIIFANHPTGSLDGLSLLKVIQDIRTDVRILADNTLMNFHALGPLLIPQGSDAKSVIKKALANQEIVTVFPATQVSQAGPSGIKDRNWRADFLIIARETKAPLIPVLLDGRNSSLFYFINFICRPIGQLLLNRELFKANNRAIEITVGNSIAANQVSNPKLNDRHLTKRLRKFIYQLNSEPQSQFITEKPLARAESPKKIQQELDNAVLLGETHDNHQIFLANYRKGSPLIREIGRLRELTFRKVGEGTGSSRDLDRYDTTYRHLVLWHKAKQQIVGAYRIGEGNRLILSHGIDSLYTSSLHKFSEQALPYLRQSLELGRSFIHPDYWGKGSLDYLWQGIGAIIRHNPDIRYLIGPVSMSADYSKSLIDELVFYFQHYFQSKQTLSSAYQPYHLPLQRYQELSLEYQHLNKDEGMNRLQESFKSQGAKIPVLFKQYTALYEDGGIQLLGFSVDPDFGDCIDGLLLADLTKLKEKKRKRYIGE